MVYFEQDVWVLLCTQLNRVKYFYQTSIILFISLDTIKSSQVFLPNEYNSIY